MTLTPTIFHCTVPTASHSTYHYMYLYTTVPTIVPLCTSLYLIIPHCYPPLYLFIPHCTSLYPTVTLHCTSLYPTVTHCISLYQVDLPPTMDTIAEEPSGGEDSTSNEGSDHNQAGNVSSGNIQLQVSTLY